MYEPAYEIVLKKLTVTNLKKFSFFWIGLGKTHEFEDADVEF